MRSKAVKTLLMLSAASCLSGLTPLSAQESNMPQAENDEPGDVIVVTARRREESLQDVPGSVTAIGGDDLATFAADEIGDIQTSVPNLTLH